MMASQGNGGSAERALGVVNLGNTCYMNAVLQALAHAPDLCMAMYVESHRDKCPTFQSNKQRREEQKKQKKTDPDACDSVPPAPVAAAAATVKPEPADAIKAESDTTGKKGKNGGKRGKKGRSMSPIPPTVMVDPDFDEDDEFCLLCEMEKHMERVQPTSLGISGSKLDGSSLTPQQASGFGSEEASASAVAPSTFVNGFIRHVAPWFQLGKQEDSHEFLRLLIDAMQKSCTKARVDTEGVKVEENAQDKGKGEGDKNPLPGGDTEYPFRLFRGIVESNVHCGSCNVMSTKLDPIEDVGLEVTAAGGQGGAMTDVDASLKRFVRLEELDSGYKCDKCGKVGKATKTSKLASIPPILTLHLKRFRYGGMGVDTSSRRAPHGSSGSAKIEGHIPFKPIVNIAPYLTEEQQKISKLYTLCRLFAVIVHAGKNSHSGHYIAYVKNVSKGKKEEWWKMDDAKVTQVSAAEVMSAEAYMLFYRVINHPISKTLEKEKESKDAERAKIEAKTKLEETSSKSAQNGDTGAKSSLGKRKLRVPDYQNCVEWARSKTNIKLDDVTSLATADELVSENIQLTADYFKLLVEDADDESISAPSGVSVDEDIQGGSEHYRLPILKYIHQLVKNNGGEGEVFSVDLENGSQPLLLDANDSLL